MSIAELTFLGRAGVPVRRGWWWVQDVEQTVRFERLVIRCAWCNLVQFGQAVSSQNPLGVKERCVRCGASDESREAESRPIAQECVLTAPDDEDEYADEYLKAHGFSSESFRGAISRAVLILRRAHGYSQRGLAACLGCPRTFISKIEREHTTPSIETIYRLAEALEVSAQMFVEIVQLFYSQNSRGEENG